MKSLTDKQNQLLSFIDEYLNEHLQMPTLDEIGKKFNISATGVYYHLKALEKKGVLHIDKNTSRGICLVDSLREKRENISIDFFQSEPSAKEVIDGSELKYFIPREFAISKPFAFKVSSLSMKEAGILIDDIAIMENTDIANNGDIVLAYIPETQNKIGLRRFVRTPHFIQLSSENESMGNIKSVDIKVYGVLKALRRIY